MSHTPHDHSPTGEVLEDGLTAAIDGSDALFDRPAPPEYLEEWRQRLATSGEVPDEVLLSVVVFRLGEEWLAIRTRSLVEVTRVHPIHSVPHRTGEVLRGLVNVRGQLRMAISLHGLLGVDRVARGHPPAGKAALVHESDAGRMVLLQDRTGHWAFEAEDVLGVHRIKAGQFRRVPSTLGKAASYCESVFAWRGRTVGLLDDERVFSALRSLGS